MERGQLPAGPSAYDDDRDIALRCGRLAADISGIKPGTIPAGLSGNQLTAYLEGYDAASAWSFVGEAFEASSLGSQLQVSFFRGFNDRLSEVAKNEQAS